MAGQRANRTVIPSEGALTPRSERGQTRLAPDVRRQQILDEATRLISRSGFNAVSLSDIAVACGIRKQTISYYFPTTSDLLAAVLQQRDLREYAESALPETLRSSAALAGYLRGVVEQNLQSREIVRLFAVLRTEAIDPAHPAHKYFAERERLAVAALSAVLAWKARPVHAASELLAFWNGLEIQWVWNPATEFLAVWDEFADHFFRS